MIKETVTQFGTYKTGRFQGSNKTWYGFVQKGQTMMAFITQAEYERGVTIEKPPELDPPPF